MILLEKQNVRILNEAKDWKTAIRFSVMPLEEQGYVETRYKEEIISNVVSMGPYIVLAPYVALPHARPEQGVIKSQIAVTLYKNEVFFEKGIPAKLFIVLAASDNSSHLDALVSITEILQDEAKVAEILKADDIETLYQYFI